MSYLERDIPLSVVELTASTNTSMRLSAEAGAPAGSVIIALRQSAGRGRQGHTFLSPSGGLYMSVLFRPESDFRDITFMTPAAAVAVCEALESLYGIEPQIKWVNDVFLRGKKICGILAEGAPSPDSGRIEYAVIGIGLNAVSPAEGFPPEIRDTAGAVFESGADINYNMLASRIISRVLTRCESELPDTQDEYSRRSMLIGSDIGIISDGTTLPATALGIDNGYGLRVRLGDGSEKTLTCGEVSVKRV